MVMMSVGTGSLGGGSGMTVGKVCSGIRVGLAMARDLAWVIIGAGVIYHFWIYSSFWF